LLRLGEQSARGVAAGVHTWNSPRIPPCIDPTTEPARAEVICDLGFEVEEHATLALQVAVARTAGAVIERLDVTLDGAVLPVEEIETSEGGRIHLVRSGPGALSVRYRGEVTPTPPGREPLTISERIVGLRQSRYCQSDRLEGFASSEFDGLPDDADRARAVGSWVFERIRYELGSSGPLDTAVDTLLAGAGVCRDFAHLTVALCRALGLPSRLVAVYAPGLWPMDFHAVAEVAVDGQWQIIDSTRLAPRQSLVRIATGRDAADTAFCSTIAGFAELTTAYVGATTDADLPLDDHAVVVQLP
jgi:transglutaminase-like putative cysteine protease